jgi:hypothetical protein
MAEVFAGFVAGYAMALLSTPVVAIAIVRLRATSPLLARLFPEGISATPLAVILHGALFLFWTALGIVLGLMLLAMRDSGEAIGSLNGAFTLLVIGLTLAIVAPIVIVLRQVRPAVLLAGLTVVLVFGWLMPYLADWSNFPDPPTKERPAPQVSWFV